MGLKNSPYWFESTIQAFTRSLIFHRPDLFAGETNLFLLYSYMDDFMCGAGYRTGSLKAAFTHSLHQQAYLRAMGSFLGLIFKSSKTAPLTKSKPCWEFY